MKPVILTKAAEADIERAAVWYEDVIACLHGKRDRILAKERALGILQMPDPK